MPLKVKDVQAISPDERAALAVLKDTEADALQELLDRIQDLDEKRKDRGNPRDTMALLSKVSEARQDALLLRGVRDDDIAAVMAENRALKASGADAERRADQLSAEVEALRETVSGLRHLAEKKA